jgi:hypothetical protein
VYTLVLETLILERSTTFGLITDLSPIKEKSTFGRDTTAFSNSFAHNGFAQESIRATLAKT